MRYARIAIESIASDTRNRVFAVNAVIVYARNINICIGADILLNSITLGILIVRIS